MTTAMRLLLRFALLSLRMQQRAPGRLGLEREFSDLQKDLNDAVWPDGKPPEAYHRD
jgi:hypothetical protein